MTTQDVDSVVPFATIADALEGVDFGELSVKQLVSDGRGVSVHAVFWPANWEQQECAHPDFDEIGIVWRGSLIDKTGSIHSEGAVWLRSQGEIHYPRSGTDGAWVLLVRIKQPA